PACDVLPHRVFKAPAQAEQIAHIDFAVSMGSLCRYRRERLDQFESSANGYLGADESGRRRFGDLIARMSPGTRHPLKVGLMWSSNPARGVDWGERRAAKKSIDPQLLELLSGCHDVRFISLQNRDAGDGAAEAPGLDLLDFQDHLRDMADTAALIANLDLVISVDTSIAHLAGALGTPVWILLMKSCDWRWGRELETTPWYSSARLIRQTTAGDWRPVLETVARDLRSLAPPRASTGAADEIASATRP
ncbi:MAG: hypothetical protein DWQ08_11105, partial [Proteobacteria bacterium]